MASIIRIKRSGTTGSPPALAQGEFAYSFLDGTLVNGGDRLYLGTGTEINGEAANIEVIGGKYFTQKLDHTPGVVTANSAIITDENNIINILNVDNITIDDNTISSTNLNGNIVFSVNGTGVIDAGNTKIVNVSTPTANNDVTNKEYVDGQISALETASNFDYVGDTGADSLFLASEILSFIGGTGLSTAVGNNSVTITLDNTGVVAGTYGSSSSIPVLTINAQGQITVANTVNISTDLSIAGDTGIDSVSLLNDTLTFTGGTGLTSLVSNNQVEFFLDNTAVAAGSFGNVDTVATFTVDQQGRITAAANANILITSLQVSDFVEAAQDAIGLDFIAGDAEKGITVTYNDALNSLLVSADDATTTTKGVARFNTDDFDVTAGEVTLEDTVVKIITTDDGSLTPSGHAFSILGGEGIDVNHIGTTITINGEDASDINKGIASFSNTNFTVTAGNVTANDLTIGSTSLTIGESTTFLAGLASIEVDNIRIDGNVISSTNLSGDIVLDPEGNGNVDVNNSRILNVLDPINATDVATKSYVDEVAQGLKARTAANAYSESNLPSTYDNGVLGAGATLTSTVNGAFPVIDGVTLDPINIRRILIAGQTNAAHNGLYVLIDAGSISTPWVLRRCVECDSAEEIPGSFVFIAGGSGIYANTGWVATVADQSTFVVGTDAISWAQFSGAGTFTDGNGLSLIGTEFNVNVDNASIEIFADALRVKASGITNDMLAGSIANEKLINSTISFSANTGTIDAVSLGETLAIISGTGVGITTAVSNNTITISGVDATSTIKGVASFVDTDFIVTSGAVSINVEKIQDEVAAFVIGGRATTITYNDAANTLTFDSDLATTTTVGVASFNSSNFAVSVAGEVTVNTIDGGTY